MRKSKFISVLAVIVMVLSAVTGVFAASPTIPMHEEPATAVDEAGKTVEVEAKPLAKTDETMKVVDEAGSAAKLIVKEEQKLAVAVALATQSAGLDDLSVAAAMSVKVKASKENPVTVSMPITAAEANGSVVVMEKTDDGWTVVPATIADGQVSATLTAEGDVVVMVAPATAEAPVDGAPDVPEKKWYQTYENFAVIAEIVDADDVRPEDVTTRGEFLQMLFNMVGRPASTNANEFTDMEGFEDFEDAINWAVENGICSGYADKTVRCSKKITRQEMVMMLYNFAKYQETNTTDTTELSQFADADNVADWAETAVKWAAARGIVSGTSENTLAPEHDSMRCQAVTVLFNYVVAQ